MFRFSAADILATAETHDAYTGTYAREHPLFRYLYYAGRTSCCRGHAWFVKTGCRRAIRSRPGLDKNHFLHRIVFFHHGHPHCKRPFSGKAFARVQINKENKILSLNQNSFGINENPKTVNIEAFDLAITESKSKVIELKKNTGKMSVLDAEILVSGGRGLKKAENFTLLEETIEILGATATVACTKPVADLEWRPHSEHVGQTGKVVAPKLYFAVGISGAIQHLAGITSSKVIVSINSDKDAPIFEASDYGVIGDAMEVMPKLNQALRAFKENA